MTPREAAERLMGLGDFGFTPLTVEYVLTQRTRDAILAALDAADKLLPLLPDPVGGDLADEAVVDLIEALGGLVELAGGTNEPAPPPAAVMLRWLSRKKAEYHSCQERGFHGNCEDCGKPIMCWRCGADAGEKRWKT